MGEKIKKGDREYIVEREYNPASFFSIFIAALLQFVIIAVLRRAGEFFSSPENTFSILNFIVASFMFVLFQLTVIVLIFLAFYYKFWKTYLKRIN